MRNVLARIMKNKPEILREIAENELRLAHMLGNKQRYAISDPSWKKIAVGPNTHHTST